MRFSAVFHLPITPQTAAGGAAPQRVEESVAPVQPVVQQSPSFADLPDDLDQRVRLVGEWQLGED